MNEQQPTHALPRMRTIKKAIEEIKELDPNTALNESQLRQMVKAGKIQKVTAGRHTLINLDLLIEYLASDAYQNGETAQPAPQYGKLRRIEE